MPKKPYDDERYVAIVSHELPALIGEFLDMEGNTKEDLKEQFEQALDNCEEE